MARLWARDGVNPLGGGLLTPSAFTGTQVTISSGSAWVDGHFCELTAGQVLDVTANGIVVVRFDPATNSSELVYRDGISTPTQIQTGVWEIVIAQITGGVLTDVRTFAEPKGENRRLAYKKTTADSGYYAVGAGMIKVPGGNLPAIFPAVPTTVQVTAQFKVGTSAAPLKSQIIVCLKENVTGQEIGRVDSRVHPDYSTAMEIIVVGTDTIPAGRSDFIMSIMLNNADPVGQTLRLLTGSWAAIDRINE